MRRIISFVIFAITIITLAIINVPYIVENANLGVEFEGGYEIVYEVASKEDGKELTTEEKDELTEAAADVIVSRLDIFGVKNPFVEVEEGYNTNKQIRVTVGAVSYDEFKEIKDLIVSDIELSFRDKNDVDLVQEIVSKDPSLGDGSDLLNGAQVAYSYDGRPGIILNINNTDLFEEMTAYLATRKEAQLNTLVIWMNYDEETDSFNEEMNKPDSKIIVTIDIDSAITIPNPFIQGSFTIDYAKVISNKLKAGSIDYKLVPSGYETKINAAYGSDAINKTIIASAAALVLITLILVVVYGIPGLASSILMIGYAGACFATLTFLKVELGPDAFSAIVIGAGLALNTSIILFERIKDELLKGRNLAKSFEEGSKKTISSVVDSNLAALVVSLVLFFIGTRTVKTFATMLFLCVVFSAFLMVFLLRLILSFLFKSHLLSTRKNLFGVKLDYIPDVKANEPQKYFGKFANTNFKKLIKNSYFVTLGVIVLGAVGLLIFGLISQPLNLGSHFAPGSRITITSNLETYDDVDEIKKLFNENGIENFDINVGSSYVEEEKTYLDVFTLRFNEKQITSEQIDAIDTVLNDIQEGIEDETLVFKYEISNVSSKVPVRILTNASIVLGLAALAALIYTFVRFGIPAALANVVNIVITVASVLSVFIITRLEINTEFVTAILGVMTFAIFDFMFVYDRLRENVLEANPNLDNEARVGLINKTIQQTFTRTLISLAGVSLIPLSLVILGSTSTIYLALTLLLGVIFASFYSSFVSTRVWLFFENKLNKPRKAKKFKPKKTSDEPEEVTFIGVNDYR